VNEELEALAKALTPKERAFAEAYAGACRGNATRAAEKAGYQQERRATLTEIGSRLARKVNVRTYIDALLSAHSITAAEVTRELTDIAKMDLTPYLKIENRELVLDYEAMKKDDKLHLVAGFEFSKAGDCIPVLHSKHAALTLLVRVLGMGSEKVEHEHTGQVTIREYPEGI
jgi:hypothetical protein